MKQQFVEIFQGFQNQDSDQMIFGMLKLQEYQKIQFKQFGVQQLNEFKLINQEFFNFIQKYHQFRVSEENQELDLAMDILIKITKEKDNWFMKFAKYFTRLLKKIDVDLAVQKLRNFLGELQLIRSNQEKRLGILFCINELFWCFFKLVNYHQCRSFLSIVEQNYQDIFDQFPVSEKVTYYYYSGRMAFFENQFLRAKQQFGQCIALMSSYQGSNKHNIQRQIFKYYIPVQILNGIMPTKEFLLNYEFQEYIQLSHAIKRGDQHKFKLEVDKHTKILIKRGLYLIIERFEQLLIRNLLKKAQVFIVKQYNLHQIDTEVFQKALNMNSLLTKKEYSLDQTEFVLANLIYQGYIKGYISHEKRKVVFSKNNPFGKIQDVIKKQYD